MIKVGKKQNQTMFIITKGFKFLDVLSYLGPAKTYDSWVKAFGCELKISWFPYEWFDSSEKLDFPGLPDYPCWFSKLKDSFTLSLQEFRQCKKTFKDLGMKTFADWLRYYNNLDVGPFVEALMRMRDFYSKYSIDIFKDAVSLPGVSMKFVLRGTLMRPNPPQLFAPGKEAHDMLKASVTGGPSIVFTRYHEAGVTRIRSHQFSDAHLCRQMLGYDANALHLSTMAKEMPYGEGLVTHWGEERPEVVANQFIENLREGRCFGFAEVDIEVPENLWPKFEEMPPLFYNKEIPETSVPKEMFEYLQHTGRTRVKGQKKLIGALSAENILLYAPFFAGISIMVLLSHEFIEQLTTNKKSSLAGSSIR